MGMRWLLVVALALALVGACATQQALIETDRRMDEIALRVAAVEGTSQRLASTQPEQARAQAETIACLQIDLAQARAWIAQPEAGGMGTESRLGALEGESAPARRCCKICTKGIPCGDTCISASKTCRKGPGCACGADGSR
jgi:hypothetical protein